MHVRCVRDCLTLIFCLGMATMVAGQMVPVPVHLGPDTAVCTNDSILLDASYPDCSYLWSNGATTATLVVRAFPGTYSVTVTDTTGTFTPGSDTIYLSDLNIPPVSISPGGTVSACNGGVLQLTGAFGGTSKWYRNGLLIPGSHTYTYQVTMPGIYNMTKTNQNGCTDSAEVGTIVNFIPPPNAGWTADKDTVDLAISGEVNFADNSSGASAWSWNFGDGNTSMVQNPVHSYALAGNYTVTQIATEGNCSDTLRKTIVVEGIVAVDPFSGQESSIMVFPNPATDVLHVKVMQQGKYKFELLNMGGVRLSATIVAPGLRTFDLGELPRGIYFYRFSKNGAFLTSGKLSIQ